MEPRRGIEGTGIVVWDEQHTEHVAHRAAEIGDAKVEALCDAVHAGLAEDEELVDLIELDLDYFEWMIRGHHLGWQTRTTET